MALLNRTPRPLTRDKTDFRDSRLFIIACDDTYAPQQYFDFFKLSRVKIHVIPTADGSSHAAQVLERLKKVEYEEDDQRWMLLDTDHCIEGAHLPNFLNAIKEAKEADIQVAISRCCFEIWLLLHHVDENEVMRLANAKDVEKTLRIVLGEYNKTNLKKEHFPIASVVRACQRASRLDAQVNGGDIPENNTSRVYKLWEEIINNALPSQIPEELLLILKK